MPTVDEIEQLFQQRGNSEYGGEAVTQLEHALQSAMLAEQEDSDETLIAAALLHDVGHLLHKLPDDAPDQGIDDHHENSGYNFLRHLFPPSVTEPVRLHVASKRYLCTKQAGYRETLSQPSIVSLSLQGGLMSSEEVEEFERNPFWTEALRVRQWDDQAKVVGLSTPPLSHFFECVRRVALKEA